MQFLAIVGLIVAISVAHSAEYKGSARTIDGNTIDLAIGNTLPRISLCGIDAPKVRQKGGPEAALALMELIEGKDIRCIQVGSGAGTPCVGRSKPTNHGRIVAQCFWGDKDIAEEMVLLRHACDWPKFSGSYYQRKVRGACVTNR